MLFSILSMFMLIFICWRVGISQVRVVTYVEYSSTDIANEWQKESHLRWSRDFNLLKTFSVNLTFRQLALSCISAVWSLIVVRFSPNHSPSTPIEGWCFNFFHLDSGFEAPMHNLLFNEAFWTSTFFQLASLSRSLTSGELRRLKSIKLYCIDTDGGSEPLSSICAGLTWLAKWDRKTAL